MGSGESSNASAYTYIETSASGFIPGATVTGNVKILSQKPIQAGQMTILLTCTSELQWITPTRRARHRNAVYDKRTLFSVQFPIWNFQGQLPQGQFILPFCIQLPIDLIPSFSLEPANNSSLLFARKSAPVAACKNEYTFEAVIDGSNEVQAQKTIVWVSRLPKPNEAILPTTTEANIKVTSCCIFQSGNVELRTTASRNVAMANEMLTITSKINNSKNKHKVNRIKSVLVRHLRLKTSRHVTGFVIYHARTTLSRYEYPLDDRHVDIKPGASDPLECAISLSLSQLQDLWMMPSIASEGIDCEYFIKVTLEFDNFCGCGVYSVYLPIEICNGMIVINRTFSPPPQINVAWNPSMLANHPVAAQGHANQPNHVHGILH